MNMSQEKIGLLILRFGLVLVYVYFAISQLSDVNAWAGAVPAWGMPFGISATSVVMFNAVFELVFAALLALGFWPKTVSILLAIHLGLITIAMGYNPIGARDFGLTAATLAHGFISDKK